MKRLTFEFWVPDETSTAAVNGDRLTVATIRKYLATLDKDTQARQLTETDITELARGIAERDYRATVTDIIDNLRDEITAGNITTADDAQTWLHETIDGHHDVIYTFHAKNVIMQSRNEDAYFEHFGTEGAVSRDGINWSALAYAALEADVNEEIGNLDELIESATETDGE